MMNIINTDEATLGTQDIRFLCILLLETICKYQHKYQYTVHLKVSSLNLHDSVLKESGFTSLPVWKVIGLAILISPVCDMAFPN